MKTRMLMFLVGVAINAMGVAWMLERIWPIATPPGIVIPCTENRWPT